MLTCPIRDLQVNICRLIMSKVLCDFCTLLRNYSKSFTRVIHNVSGMSELLSNLHTSLYPNMHVIKHIFNCKIIIQGIKYYQVDKCAQTRVKIMCTNNTWYNTPIKLSYQLYSDIMCTALITLHVLR